MPTFTSFVFLTCLLPCDLKLLPFHVPLTLNEGKGEDSIGELIVNEILVSYSELKWISLRMKGKGLRFVLREGNE